MKVVNRFYAAGYILLIVLAIAGELVWLGDPIRWKQLYWIDRIESLVDVLAVVPLLWLLGALAGLVGARGPRGAGGPLRSTLKALAAVAAIAAAVAIVRPPLKPAVVIALAGAALLLTLLDTAIDERRMTRRPPLRSLALVAALAIAAGVLFWPTPYQIDTPGFTLNMNRYAEAEGGEPKGSIEGILVIERPAFPIDWLYAAIFPHLHIEKRDTGISLAEIQQQAHIQRADANQIASAVAFQKVGIGRGVIPEGVRIVGLTAGSPAEGQLAPGDLIVGLNGGEIRSLGQLTETMKEVEPGDAAQVTFVRDGKRIEASVKTAMAEDEPQRAVFGIQVEDAVTVDLPKKVDYRSYLVYQGGPSHGAIMALTLIDQLTPGGVTYGNRTAGTGTIAADGSVGPIGGIEQKAYAVGRSNADVFFVPAEQEGDARKGSPKLNIVGVRTLDDMLAWLKAHPKGQAAPNESDRG